MTLCGNRGPRIGGADGVPMCVKPAGHADRWCEPDPSWRTSGWSTEPYSPHYDFDPDLDQEEPVMTAYVTQIKAHNAYRDKWEITVERDWSSSRPRSSDLPADVREALRKWLDEST